MKKTNSKKHTNTNKDIVFANGMNGGGGSGAEFENDIEATFL